jgi:hypothetical protein
MSEIILHEWDDSYADSKEHCIWRKWEKMKTRIWEMMWKSILIDNMKVMFDRLKNSDKTLLHAIHVSCLNIYHENQLDVFRLEACALSSLINWHK